MVCWGSNRDGQLGIGSTTDVGTSASDMGVNLQAVNLGTGIAIIGSAYDNH